MPSDRPTSAPSRHALRIGSIVALVVAGAVVVTGIATRASSNEKLKQWTMEQALPSVSVILPSASGELS
ncbi:MAG: efflux RND transporter periplasmic adaptor subunit, partial [Methylophilaceae bacterium]